jgi:hypothetical protein
LDHGAQRARGELIRPEQFEDAAAHRITENVERVHSVRISVWGYISEVF